MDSFSEIKSIIDQQKTECAQKAKSASLSKNAQSLRGGMVACDAASAALVTLRNSGADLISGMATYTEMLAKNAVDSYHEADADKQQPDSLKHFYYGCNTYSWQLHESISELKSD